ncbi:FtsP/CotA-like multicopper oxidase with cupredoxin domain [Sinorhizobium fredii]
MTPLLSRRTFLQGSAALGGAFALGAGLAARAGAAPEPQLLTAQLAKAQIAGDGVTPVMTYGLGETTHAGMPPVLRMRKGEAYAARLMNRLDEPTTIHWHGLRIANAMDGVPEMTQPYVYPGDHFDYLFTPPDAGTFWYHPHCNTLTQMGHGLTGLIVVENPADPTFDAEIVLNLRDWRLGAGGKYIDPFKPRDAARGGTYGTVRTANWQQEPVYDAPAGGLVRVRIAATDVTRIYTIGLEGAEAKVVALDGNPVERPFLLDRLDIGPGQRVDLVMRMPDSEGARATLGNFRGSNPWTIASLQAVGPSLKRDLGDVAPLPANPVARADLSTAKRNSPRTHRDRRTQSGTIGLRFARLHFLGAQQGSVVGRHARPDCTDRGIEARQKLCARNRQPHPARASYPPAWLELPHPELEQAKLSAAADRHDPVAAGRTGGGGACCRQSRRLGDPLPHHRTSKDRNDRIFQNNLTISIETTAAKL